MTKKLVVLTLTVLGALCAQGTKPVQPTIQITAAMLADAAVQQLLDVRNKVESKEKGATYPTGHRPSDLEFELIIQRRVRMAAEDIISNFASRINQHHASPQEVCAGTKLLDAAFKRYLDNKLGQNASQGRKGYEVEELFRTQPAIQMLYTNIGYCSALAPWLDKTAPITAKK